MIGSLLATSFAAPWVLLALAALPLLWWLLRVTPPAPRREVFPAIRLLLGLTANAETPAHTPLWLLMLRMFAAALVIVGLARPILDAGGRLSASGPLLLVIDDGWASAAAWGTRMAAAQSALDRAERGGRGAALLTTAPGEDGAVPALTPVLPVADLRPRVAALRPKPWPTDRVAAAAAVHDLPAGPVVYITDGLAGAHPVSDDVLAAELAASGPVEELRDVAQPLLLLPPRAEADRLVARVLSLAAAAPREVPILAQSGDGRTLARVTAKLDPGADSAEAAIVLPPELRNRLTRLVIEGPSSAGSVALLDERWRRRPVGLLAGDATTAEAPLTGPLYYLRRALGPYAELREGDLKTLLARDLSVLILTDHEVTAGPELEEIKAFVTKGGTLLRFAGPTTAEHADPLLPVKLIEGDRQLGGAMSWAQPAGLAVFEPASPFAGLPVPGEVRVTRQVLAAPSLPLQGAAKAVPGMPADAPVWARLTDGTPLVTQARMGAGRIVLFHVTANADWSNLPLSGLFVDMLRRLVDLASGVSQSQDADATLAHAPLAPAETMDGFGVLGRPSFAAQPLEPRQLATALASPRHPPGLYGPEAGRMVLNLGTGIAGLQATQLLPGAQERALGDGTTERPLAPWLMAAALALLAVDLLLSLRLRGLWLRPAALLFMLALTSVANAQSQSSNPALTTRLAYFVTDDAAVDDVSRAGLVGLSDYVNRRTNAALGDPAPVRPGTDDLSFYPLIYWPITADAAAPDAATAAALNGYMAHGGIILIDTRGGGDGSGAAFAPDADTALVRASAGLTVPALVPLSSAHVLARAFYLLQDFPGRYEGDPVWVQRDQDRTNDSVSPVIIGSNDWAAAWAIDEQGRNPYATLPGGARQRVLAYRFGVNLVMYALTGNYKGDQVHVPALLERLGQ